MDDYHKLAAVKGEYSRKSRKRMSRQSRSALKPQHDESKDPKVVKQVLAFAIWMPNKNLVTGGRFDPVHVDGGQRPDNVWTLFSELDPLVRPALPIVPIHGVNALSEDPGHDWNWYPKQPSGPLKYQSRAMSQSCWVLLEYFQDGGTDMKN